jgi:hypothetical protein
MKGAIPGAAREMRNTREGFSTSKTIGHNSEPWSALVGRGADFERYQSPWRFAVPKKTGRSLFWLRPDDASIKTCPAAYLSTS